MGGLVLGVLGILLFCLIRKKDPRKIADAFVIPCACGIVILKIGCFLNGCCFGKHTTRPWGMVFPANEKLHDFIDPLGIIYQGNHAVHPTQLYEILGVLVALAVALAFQKKLKERGKCDELSELLIPFLKGNSLGIFDCESKITSDSEIVNFDMSEIVYPLFYAAIILVSFGYVIYSFRKAEKSSAKSDQNIIVSINATKNP